MHCFQYFESDKMIRREEKKVVLTHSNSRKLPRARQPLCPIQRKSTLYRPPQRKRIVLRNPERRGNLKRPSPTKKEASINPVLEEVKSPPSTQQEALGVSEEVKEEESPREEESKEEVVPALYPARTTVVMIASHNSTVLIIPQDFDITESGSVFSSSVHCPPRVALALLSRDLDLCLRTNLPLIELSYDGIAFHLSANEHSVLILAMMQLRLWMAISLLLPDQEPIQVCSAGEDLKNVPFEKDLQYRGEKTCAICLAEIEEGELVRRTPCLHVFHSQCISTWLRTRRVCPVDKYFLEH